MTRFNHKLHVVWATTTMVKLKSRNELLWQVGHRLPGKFHKLSFWTK